MLTTILLICLGIIIIRYLGVFIIWFIKLVISSAWMIFCVAFFLWVAYCLIF